MLFKYDVSVDELINDIKRHGNEKLIQKILYLQRFKENITIYTDEDEIQFYIICNSRFERSEKTVINFDIRNILMGGDEYKELTITKDLVQLLYPSLFEVMSSSEAEERWSLKPGTVRAACTRGKLHGKKGVKKIGNTWLVTADVMEKYYGEEKKMENLQETLKGWFKFKEWSAHKKQPTEFVDTLDAFIWIDTYNNFKDFLLHNDIYLEDPEGEHLDINEVLSTKERFSEFKDNQFNLSLSNDIEFEQINEPVIYAQVKGIIEPQDHFITLSTIKTVDDLLAFINEVLTDVGEVTHYTGLKNKYEVIGIDNE
jgi:hypothetical protein